MSESPRKRQRLSPENHLPLIERSEADEHTARSVPAPTTPTRRASYRSPTKASLARSHPDILAKSPKRGAATEPRGRLLRQELLGTRREGDLTPTLVPKTAPRPSHTAERKNDSDQNARLDKDGFAEAIARSFQTTDTVRTLDVDPSHASARSPPLVRQPPNVSTGKRNRDNKDTNFLANMPIPSLVKKTNTSAQQRPENEAELDLPPTPVQLGIGPAPSRPRGLASSSSAGSRSGSGRHRRRTRDGGRSTITSSPLKPKNRGLMSPPVMSDIEDLERESGNEGADSDTENVGASNTKELLDEASQSETLPAQISEKQDRLADLKTELEKLRQQLEQLESLTGKLQKGVDLDASESALSLLQEKEGVRTIDSQSPDRHPNFVKDPAAYLKLFAPGRLHLNHNTASTTIQKRLEVTHELSIVAPSPWPPDTMRLSFLVCIDAEHARIKSVTRIKAGLFHRREGLERWIENRLQDPIHKYDIGSVIWGSGQYFDACISRAKVLRTIDERFGKQEAYSTSAVYGIADDDLMLSPYLHKSQARASAAGDSEAGLAHTSDRPPSRQIVLNYDIELDWTGDAKPSVDIVLAGINGKAQGGAKELFARLLPTEGVVGAFERVWNLLTSQDEVRGVVLQKSQPMRARRIAEVS